ncbi:MAG: hypothetical protein OHK0026_05330 [Rhodocyclaceae bacterium]
MNFSPRNGLRSAFRHAEDRFDIFFGAAANPLRHLGALGFFLFWIVLAAGIYLFIVIDTGITQVYESVSELSRDSWALGGILRSIHRYGSDAFMLVLWVHLAREWAYGRDHGFRWYSWVSGVPLIWLAYTSGIGGYWIPWDRLAQFSALASAEWLDALPAFGGAISRNFASPGALSDRFFTLLVFIHLGVPLLLLVALWAHVQRVSRVDHFPARQLALGTAAMLVALALIAPARLDAPADLSVVPAEVALDWIILFIHPLAYAVSNAAAWLFVAAVSVVLLALPLLPHPRPEPVARVSAANCNGCSRCFADCPYAAVVMEPHPDKPGHKLARVVPELCAGCGICAGACPSSTPFRSVERIVTGIDMPQQPVDVLRSELVAGLARLCEAPRVVVFGCAEAFDPLGLADSRTFAMRLLCTGMLPPSLVEYALRSGADGVLVTGCREDGCAFRLGNTWVAQRLSGEREPRLRSNVPAQRLRVLWADALDGDRLRAGLAAFRRDLEALGAQGRPRPIVRRIVGHG